MRIYILILFGFSILVKTSFAAPGVKNQWGAVYLLCYGPMEDVYAGSMLIEAHPRKECERRAEELRNCGVKTIVIRDGKSRSQNLGQINRRFSKNSGARPHY